MAFVTRYNVTVNVTASGGVTHGADIRPTNGGWLEAIVVRNATANGISTAANLLISQDGQTFWNSTSTGASNSTLAWYPRTQVHLGTTGAGFTSAATPPAIVDKFPVAAGRAVHIQVASGGPTSVAAKSVQVDLLISGN